MTWIAVRSHRVGVLGLIAFLGAFGLLEVGSFALQLGIAGEPCLLDSGVRHSAARLTFMPAISKAALGG